MKVTYHHLSSQLSNQMPALPFQTHKPLGSFRTHPRYLNLLVLQYKHSGESYITSLPAFPLSLANSVSPSEKSIHSPKSH